MANVHLQCSETRLLVLPMQFAFVSVTLPCTSPTAGSCASQLSSGCAEYFGYSVHSTHAPVSCATLSLSCSQGPQLQVVLIHAFKAMHHQLVVRHAAQVLCMSTGVSQQHGKARFDLCTPCMADCYGLPAVLVAAYAVCTQKADDTWAASALMMISSVAPPPSSYL